MALIQIPSGTKIPFLGMRWVTYTLSLVVMSVTLLVYGIYGLNYGIDFKGGISVEIRLPQKPDLGEMRTTLGRILDRDISIQEFGSSQDLLIRVEKHDETEGDAQAVVSKIQETLGSDVDYRRIETIGPKVGRELVNNGILAMLLALLGMGLYVWCRFEWRFGIAAFLALLNDCIWVFGLFTIFRLEFNETAIVAILTTAAYSINDTVVIFDRIRENRRKYQKMPFAHMVNLSVNETLSRTTLTSLTTLSALAILYFFGGPIIAAFSLPIFVGLAAGTYSSIFLAAPLLTLFQGQSSGVLANGNKAANDFP